MDWLSGVDGWIQIVLKCLPLIVCRFCVAGRFARKDVLEWS